MSGQTFYPGCSPPRPRIAAQPWIPSSLLPGWWVSSPGGSNRQLGWPSAPSLIREGAPGTAFSSLRQFAARYWSGATPADCPCRPEATRTAEFIHRRFWWPTPWGRHMGVCGRLRRLLPQQGLPPSSSRSPPPSARRPWSDIALDFVTGPPYLQGQ